MGRVVFHDVKRGLVYIKIQKSVFVLSEEEFEFFLNRQTVIHKPVEKWTNQELMEIMRNVMLRKFVLKV